MRRSLFVLVVAVVATVLPLAPASACSCAQATVDDLVARDADAAAALVRRVDSGQRRADGTLAVLTELHGELPASVTVRLDDGGSCRPMVAPGQVAALGLRPAGDGWEAIDCGMLDLGDALEQVLGRLAPDPEATGPPALVVAGSYPGAALATLDAQLRVLGVASGEWFERLLPCGDELVTFRRDDLDVVVERRALPSLAIEAAVRLQRPDGWQLLAARCSDGRVQAVANEDPADGSSLVHRDLLGAPDDVVTGPLASGAAFVAEHVWLTVDTPGRGSRLDTVELATGTLGTRRSVEGFDASELVASPDGRYVTLRGHAEEPVLLVLDTASATTVAESRGWWMPVGGGWTAPDRLLLQDESRELGTALHLRLVDPRLRIVDDVTLRTGWALGGAGDTVVVGGHSDLAVRRPDGRLHPSVDLRLVGTEQAIVLGAVRGPERAAAPAADDGTAPEGRPAPSGPADWQLALAAVATVGVVVALVLLRRRRRGRDAG